MSKTNTKDDFWAERAQHTRIKHFILKGYLSQWLPKLLSTYPKLIYVDGFAGRGRYNNGEPGSPVVALEAFKGHILQDRFKGIVQFYFPEPDPENFASLEAELKSQGSHNKIQAKWFKMTFQDFYRKFHHHWTSEGRGVGNCPPSFWFIDPFGFNVPMEIIEGVSKFSKSEVFIHLMTGHVKRFCGEATHQEHLATLMGDDGFTQRLEPSDPPWKFVDYYAEQLRKYCPSFKYVLPFELVPQNAGLPHHLIFASQSVAGFIAMKNSMWKADPSGEYRFSAREHALRDPSREQMLLFEVDKVAENLAILLGEKFRGKRSVAIKQVEKFVNEETLYLESHLRRRTLEPMVQNGLVEVLNYKGKGSRKRPAGNFQEAELRFT